MPVTRFPSTPNLDSKGGIFLKLLMELYVLRNELQFQFALLREKSMLSK